MTKLFVSYAHVDSETVNRVTEELRNAGYDIWIDARGIQGGTLWGGEIAKAILDCEVFLLFLSPKSVLSDFVRREVDIAFEEKKKILPIMLERLEIPVQLDYQLAGIQYIDYQASDWKSRLFTALGTPPAASQPAAGAALKDTAKLRNPYSALPVLERVERELILSNREHELGRGIDHLAQHRLLLVTGMPGIGKSTFARALLELVPEGSPPPFWYNFERQRSSGNSLGVLLDHLSGYLDICLDADVRREVMAFRNNPGGNASVNDVDVLISFLNQNVPIWLVFDNLETVLSRDTYEFLDEGVELLFESLKTNTHNAKLIITNPFVPILKTGELFLEAGTSPLILEGLNDDFAFAFLRAFGLLNRSKEDLVPLIREINGHPFVLNYVARYIQAMGSEVILGDPHAGMEEINQRFGDFLAKRLSTQEFNALRSLTILNREVNVSGLCQIAQVRPNIIMRLREKGLLQENEAGKFWLHNIIRNSLKPSTADVISQAHARAAKYYHNQELPVLPESIEDYASVLEWHHHAGEANDVIGAYAALFSTGLQEQLTKWNEYDLLVRLCERTLAAVYQVEANVSEIEANLSHPERLKVYQTLGTAYFLLGNFALSVAHLRVALHLLESQGNNELKSKLLIVLAQSYNGSGDSKSAMEICEQLAILLADIADQSLHAKFLHMRGIVYRDQRAWEPAVADLKAALQLYKNLNDEQHIANCTVDLGVVYHEQRRFDDAVEHYRRALSILEARRELRAAAIAHFNIGDIMLQNEKYDMAEAESQAAVEIARQRKFTNLELLAGLELVESRVALLKLESAQQELTRLKPLIAKSPSACIRGHELYLTASLHWKNNHAGQARECFQNALKLLENSRCDEELTRAKRAFSLFVKEQEQLRHY